MDRYETILTAWNAQKATGKWKTHRKITPDIRKAVDENMRDGWELEDIVSAIVNFASCCHSKDTKWTYTKWGLAQFLTRGKQEDDRRWIWFTENNYSEEDWLTDRAIKEQIKHRRLVERGREIIEDAQKKPRKPYAEMSDEELNTAYEGGTLMVRSLISKIRSERSSTNG